uniref:Uncharacterized protein n=1 Tax=uncultured marine virus TaxID=186617 RepID=A0A0F7L8U0_9VIRU|nr:hypothetical protein [uncultured marine virus]
MKLDELKKEYLKETEKLLGSGQEALQVELLEIDTLDKFKEMLIEDSRVWHREGAEHDHHLYHKIGWLADKYIKTL